MAFRCGCSRRQTIGIVGESGSGKSTLGRLLLRLLDGDGRDPLRGPTIFWRWTSAAMRPLRRELQIVFQDPYGSLSPRLTVGEIVTEGLLVHEPSLTAQRSRRARRRGARRGRPRPGHAQPLSARILRRPAPADRHRARDHPEAEDGHSGRADLGARPHGAEADRRAAASPAGRARPVLYLHQPRSRGRAGDVRL